MTVDSAVAPVRLGMVMLILRRTGFVVRSPQDPPAPAGRLWDRPSSAGHAEPFQPRIHIFGQGTAAAIAYGEGFCELRGRTELGDVGEALAQTSSSMTNEGNDGLAGKVVLFKERGYGMGMPAHQLG